MNPASCSWVLERNTGAVSRMKSFQNCPGASGSPGASESRMRRSSNPLAASVPANDSSATNTTRWPRRRRTSPMPTQLLVGPKAPSGKNTIVRLSRSMCASLTSGTCARAPDMTKIAVTGGSGKAGRVVVRPLAGRGHQVLNVDLVGSPESNHPEDPIPFLRADVTDFGQALEALSGGDTLPGIEAVVQLPAIPSPAHALSRGVGEEMPRAFHRWSGIPIIGLRFSNVMVRADYGRFAPWQGDPHARKWNLWGYVDESHVAQSVRAALDSDLQGAD